MSERVCAWCGIDISAKRADARYCCRQHKKNDAGRRFRERNPGYYKRYHGSPTRVTWLEANRDRVRAVARHQQARYREEHPDSGPEWWAANPERRRMYQAKRRQVQTFLVTERDIRRLHARWDHRCAYCGSSGPLELDHVIPIKRGGRHSIGNLVPACRSCNASKNARILQHWLMTVRLTALAERLELQEV